jgi:hypothetical protein
MENYQLNDREVEGAGLDDEIYGDYGDEFIDLDDLQDDLKLAPGGLG